MDVWAYVTQYKFVCSTYSGGVVAKSCLTLVTPWTVARQVFLAMGFPSQECWSGFPVSFSRGSSEPRSPAFRQILYRLNHQGSSSTHSEAQQIETLEFVQRNIYFRAEQEGMAHVQKTLNFLKNFGKAFLKARWRRDIPEYVISWCTVLWLMLR